MNKNNKPCKDYFQQIPKREILLKLFQNHFFNRNDAIGVHENKGNFKKVIDGNLSDWILAHVLGVKIDSQHSFPRIAAYTPNIDNTTKWLCIDCDSGENHSNPLKDPLLVVRSIQHKAKNLRIPLYIELSKSGKGYHLWIFFEEAASAKEARELGKILSPDKVTLQSGETITVGKNRGVEIFPKSDTIKENGYGNMVNLPWYYGDMNGYSRFYDFDENNRLNLIVEPITEFETLSLNHLKSILEQYPTPEPKEEKQSIPKSEKSKINRMSGEIRTKLLEKLDLKEIYGEYLTGEENGEWMECRDPRSSSGDQNPSASVADGSGEVEKGLFHSFRDDVNWDVFQFLIETNVVKDFREAVTYIAEKTNTKLSPEDFTAQIENEGDALIEELNREYAVAFAGGNAVIIREYHDYENQRPKVDFIKEHDLRLRLKNRFITVMENRESKRKNACEFWLQHPKRRQYEQVVFLPGQEARNCFNLWKGFAVEAKPGDCSLMLRHINEIICQGDERLYRYLLSWMAHAVQKPNERPETAIVLQGGQGTGKGIFVNAFGNLFGEHYLHFSHSRYLTGNFNAHLKNALILFADEAFWAGDQQGKNVLKAMITEPKLMIEMKGYDPYEMTNRLRILMASNDDWVVPADVDDRRFLVLNVSENRKGDRGYFDSIAEELKNGGYEALLDYLLKYDIENFNLRDIPKTKALLDQKIQSLGIVERFWYECLYNGLQDEDQEAWMEMIPKQMLFDRFSKKAKNAGAKRNGWEGEFGKKIARMCQELKYRRTSDHGCGFEMYNKRVNCYVFPSLERCRELFEKYIGAEIDWPVDERERGFALSSEEMNRDETEEWDRDINLDVNDRNPISGDSIQNEIDSEDVWEEESTNDEDVWKEDVWEVDVWEEDVMSEEVRDLMILSEK